ncbi:MAG: hypothetical protein FWD23_07300 [Oscillospiraceae bacterium]|nr:hypothetical protein [Oscillospiraceae bacterium]
MRGIINGIVLDGRYYDVNILDCELKPQVQEDEGSDRSAGSRLEYIVGPNGILIDLSVTFAGISSQNAEFRALWNKIMSMGTDNFMSVEIDLPVGKITQQMRAYPGPLNLRVRIRDGVTLWGSWVVDFVAKETIS